MTNQAVQPIIDYSRFTVDMDIMKLNKNDDFFSVDMYEKLQKELARNIGIPRHFMDRISTAAPSKVTDSYPMCLSKYVEFLTVSSFDWMPGYDIYPRSEVKRKLAYIDKTFPNLPVQKFLGNLQEVRAFCDGKTIGTTVDMPTFFNQPLPYPIKVGGVYDPWGRCISEHGVAQYKLVAHLAPDSIKVLSSKQEAITVWVYTTTVDKNPVTIILYCIFEMIYTVKTKIKKHMEYIEPFAFMNNPNLNLGC